jgi:hypothetical protein
MKLWVILRNIFILFISVFLLGSSVVPPADEVEQIRAFTRLIEFDYVNWTLEALLLKNEQSALSPVRYLPVDDQKQIVEDYLTQVDQLNRTRAQIERIFSDPNVSNPEKESAVLQATWEELRGKVNQIAPLVESVIQQQVSTAIAELHLSLGGQPIPPVLYHVTPLPLALIISPRGHIEQTGNISLLADVSLEEIVQLEDEVSKNLNVSALVVPIGGVGIYPTMVMSTTDLTWTIETVAHEWTHNFLTLRPLGVLYDASPELRTMNETTANISGTEIGQLVLKIYFPEFLPPPATEQSPSNTQPQPTATPSGPPPFNFNAEMRITRVNVDQLLAAGKIDESESYMETRRQYFWDNGYQIRKLNQAYFAFYGAYADQPGGAAGVDPVGPAVVALREQSKSLAEFLNRISLMTSFQELQQEIDQNSNP